MASSSGVEFDRSWGSIACSSVRKLYSGRQYTSICKICVSRTTYRTRKARVALVHQADGHRKRRRKARVRPVVQHVERARRPRRTCGARRARRRRRVGAHRHRGAVCKHGGARIGRARRARAPRARLPPLGGGRRARCARRAAHAGRVRGGRRGRHAARVDDESCAARLCVCDAAERHGRRRPRGEGYQLRRAVGSERDARGAAPRGRACTQADVGRALGERRHARVGGAHPGVWARRVGRHGGSGQVQVEAARGRTRGGNASMSINLAKGGCGRNRS